MKDFETIEELVEQRKGYKYLNKDRTSPYQNYKYVFRKGKVFKCPHLDTNPNNYCGQGWNLATLQWILNDTNVFDKIIVEFSIPEKANIIVPLGNSGKFRADLIKYERIWQPQEMFPNIISIIKKLKNYKPINPITATKLPPINKIKNIMAQMRDQVWAQMRDQVGDQVRDQVWDQVWDQVGDQVRDQMWDQVGAQVGAQVWAQMRDQVWDQVWDQVGDQVGDQVWVIAYYAVKLFMDFKYDHPAFDLIRLGIMVVKVAGKFKVFGKNGRFLGEYPE